MRGVAGWTLLLAGIAVAVSGFRGAEPSAAAAEGATLFVAKGCVACHDAPGIASTYGIGPGLTALERDRDAVWRSIRQPDAEIVPGYPNVMPRIELTDGEVASLVDFLAAPTGG